MARVLRLYANFTPNQSNNTFYMYANTAHYLTSVLGHLKQIEIPLDNYRINMGTIKIKKDLIIDFDIKTAANKAVTPTIGPIIYIIKISIGYIRTAILNKPTFPILLIDSIIFIIGILVYLLIKKPFIAQHKC